MSNLFRKEAMDHQRAKLWGDVILTQPTSYYYLVLIFLIIFIAIGLFLSSQSYARKETVTGYLSPEFGLSNIHASRGGMVDRLYVQVGDYVEKGQLLATLSLQRHAASGASSTLQQRVSLKRELSGLDQSRAEAKAVYEKESHAAENRIKGLRSELAKITEEASIITDRIDLALAQYDAARELAGKGYATQRAVELRQEALLTLQQQKSSLARQAVSVNNTLDQVAANLQILPYRLEETLNGFKQRKEMLLRQLADIDLASGYSLIAPQNGYVTTILKKEGETALPNASTLIIRPEQSLLIARLLVPSRAAGLLRTGQAAKIQYDAFPYQRFGVFKGSIKKISETILTPAEVHTPVPMQEAFYVIDLTLDSQYVTVASKNIPLKSGMLLKADIELEQRSLVQWVFDPLISLKGKI